MNRLGRISKSINDTRRSSAGVNGGRFVFAQTTQGTFLTDREPPSRWVYVIKVDEGRRMAMVKSAIRYGGSRWAVSSEPSAAKWVRFAPGFSGASFRYFVIGFDEGGEPIPGWNGQPSSSDQVCRIESGFLVPHYRFAIAGSVDLDDLCVEPNMQPLPRGGEPCCDGCARGAECETKQSHPRIAKRL